MYLFAIAIRHCSEEDLPNLIETFKTLFGVIQTASKVPSSFCETPRGWVAEIGQLVSTNVASPGFDFFYNFHALIETRAQTHARNKTRPNGTSANRKAPLAYAISYPRGASGPYDLHEYSEQFPLFGYNLLRNIFLRSPNILKLLKCNWWLEPNRHGQNATGTSNATGAERSKVRHCTLGYSRTQHVMFFRTVFTYAQTKRNACCSNRFKPVVPGPRQTSCPRTYILASVFAFPYLNRLGGGNLTVTAMYTFQFKHFSFSTYVNLLKKPHLFSLQKEKS